jgi:membrane associated rhomboid family serine protease
MTKKPIATISLILTSIITTIAAPIFDYSIYGINGHPTQWLSFMPSAPFRHYGMGILGSPFIHLSLEHLATNMILFIPIGMMIERKKSGSFLFYKFGLIHVLVLSALLIIQVGFSFEGKSFLGSSHIVLGLYCYWSLTNKNYFLLFWTILLIVLGLWQSQGLETLMSHLTGMFVGCLLFAIGKLGSKLRLKSSN